MQDGNIWGDCLNKINKHRVKFNMSFKDQVKKNSNQIFFETTSKIGMKLCTIILGIAYQNFI